MRKRNFTGLWHGAASYKTSCRNRMMRSSERRTGNQSMRALAQLAGYTINFRYFQCFCLTQHREYAGEPSNHHRFARSGRTVQQNVMPAGRSNQHGPLRMMLADHLSIISDMLKLFAIGTTGIYTGHIKRMHPDCLPCICFIMRAAKLLQVGQGKQLQTRYPCRLLGISQRKQNASKAALLRLLKHGQYTVYGPDAAVKRELSDKKRMLKGSSVQLPACS
ncbi:hypothetical protein D3C78_1234620 [compost metagenome]